MKDLVATELERLRATTAPAALAARARLGAMLLGAQLLLAGPNSVHLLVEWLQRARDEAVRARQPLCTLVVVCPLGGDAARVALVFRGELANDRSGFWGNERHGSTVHGA